MRMELTTDHVSVRPGRKTEIRRLNTLRGLAVLIVVVSHFANETGFHKALGNGGGQFGVMLFFLLSGFLMTYLYYGQPPDKSNFRSFAVARFARVVPLFYVVVIASFLLTRFGPPPYNTLLYNIPDGGMLLSHLLFLHGTSVLWTIPPEIQFYVLFGLVWACRKQLHVVLPVLLVLLLVIDYFFGLQETTTTFAGLTATLTLGKALPYFIAGSMMGNAYLRWQIPTRFRSHIYILTLLLIPLLYPMIFTWLTGREHTMWTDAGVLMVLAAVFFAVVFCVPDNNFLLENRVGDFLGKISFFGLSSAHSCPRATEKGRPVRWCRRSIGVLRYHVRSCFRIVRLNRGAITPLHTQIHGSTSRK